MGHVDLRSYDELLREFKISLTSVLSGAASPQSAMLANITLTLALNDIAYAVRQQRTTQYLVSCACAAFTDFAAEHDPALQAGPAVGEKHLKSSEFEYSRMRAARVSSATPDEPPACPKWATRC